ncbi:MAG: site-specific integrase [Planctomycetes bacterium]|nr:site-specific integrase [Planctomycetota bacterium]
MATVFKRNGKGPWIIQYFDSMGRRREKSSRTNDYRAAERIASKLESDVALRREGVIDSRQDRYAEEARKPLAQHVADYIEHCTGKGLAVHTVKCRKFHFEWLLRVTRASRLADLTLETVERALASCRAEGAAPRTVNTRRETYRAFGNWCRKTGRLASHPLELLPKFDEHRDRRRIRRPLTDEELANLLEVAERRGRRGWYLTAVLAGLRRSELIRLTWASVDLEEGVLIIRDGKAKREDVVPMHPELLAELKRIRPADAKATDRVFPTEVTNLTRKLDFERAGIKLVDERGRFADFHGLRATLGTRLARAGVAPQVAQRLMRHADYRTTLQHYTMLSLADTVAAMKRLPGGGADVNEQGPLRRTWSRKPRNGGSAAAIAGATAGDGKSRRSPGAQAEHPSRFPSSQRTKRCNRVRRRATNRSQTPPRQANVS